METKRNKRMIVVATIFTLLVVIGASYAYFTGGIKKEGDTTTTVETASLVSATAKFGGTIEASGVLPGYKVVKTINIKGGGSSKSKPISGYIILTPDVVDFSNHVKYYIYEVEGDNPIDIADICEESKNTNTNNQYYDDMKCDTSSLGTPIAQGTFSDRNKVTKEITIEYNTNKTYYILVEYVNDTENAQDEEQGKKFTINIDADTEIKILLTEQIMYLARNSEELVYDETEDNNIRYIGANPNNYVLFNNELWRIIGIINNVSDNEGNIESRVKIIRSESLGNYSWGSSNDWSTSTLKELLNEGDYYNKTGDFKNTGLTEKSKSMISTIHWDIGKTNDAETSKYFYDLERNGVNKTEWVGQIGLMYASDFGYATAGGDTINRNECLNRVLHTWSSASECLRGDWLYDDGTNIQWLLMAAATYPSHTIAIGGNGDIGGVATGTLGVVQPVVYLNNNTTYTRGSGSSDDPWVLN